MAKFQKWGKIHSHDMQHTEVMRYPYCEKEKKVGWDLCEPGWNNYIVGYDTLFDGSNVIILECPKCFQCSWFHWKREEQKFPNQLQM